MSVIRPRLSATQIKALSTPSRDRSETVTAQDAPIPIAYGETVVAGMVFAVGNIGTDLVVGVAWCAGEIEEVSEAFINDDSIPAGVTQTHYVGSIFQGVDSTLAAAIATYDDDLVLSLPRVRLGIAYSVFRIPTGEVAGFPRFRAIIKGRRVPDFSNQGERDSLYSSVVMSVDHAGEEKDISPEARTFTVASSVSLSEGYRLNSETAEGVEASNAPTIGNDDFCVEGKAYMPNLDTGIFDLCRIGEALIVRVLDSDVEIFIADGAESSWQVSAAAHTFSNAPGYFDYKLIRDGNTLSLFINDTRVWTTTTATAADIPATANALRWCYSESSPPRLGGMRSIRITQGNRRYDPASASIRSGGEPFSDYYAYSDNSAAVFGDMVTDSALGLGAKISGIVDCVAYCDSLLSDASSPRARISIVLTQPRAVPEYMDLLAIYAELRWYYEGATVVAVPDKIAAADDIYHDQKCVRGTLSIDGVSDAGTPTKVSVRYTVPTGTTPDWQEAVTSASMSGVNDGTSQLVETTLTLSGIYREIEAISKAATRLQQFQNRVKVSYVTTDIGIKYRKGDVVRVENVARGADILIRIESVKMIEYGRYQVSGLRYSESQYPTDLPEPENTGVVPVGAIVLFSGGSPPAGWDAYNDANGKFIMGAGATHAPGDTGGNADSVTFSGNTSTNSAHTAGYTRFNIKDWPIPTGGSFLRGTPVIVEPDTDHSHSYSITVSGLDLYRAEARMIIKTGSTDIRFPAAAQVFGLGNLSLADLQRITGAAGRMLKAAASNANLGAASKTASFYTSYTDISHRHTDTIGNFYDQDLDSNQTWYPYDDDFNHRHFAAFSLSRRIKRRRVALFGGINDFVVAPGIIVFWAGSTASLPADWSLCDGTNGTPDLTDHFIEIAAIGTEGTADGDNTVAISGNINSASHEHEGAPGTNEGVDQTSVPHSNSQSHAHSISNSQSWLPEYFALAAIMYNP